jgi:nitrous oxidase accessory protein
MERTLINIIRICLFACFSLAVFNSHARTWKVSPNGTLRSIQQTINQAMAGDTILVSKGWYREQTITVNKKLYLRGIDFPVLDGERKYEVLAIKASGVVVEGFDIRHSGYSSFNDIAALRMYNVRNVHIRGNKFYDTFFGIYSQHSVNCTISNNQLQSNAVHELNSANGIHCWKSDSLQIINNSVSGHRDGIYFEFVTNSLIKGNKSFKNVRYGLHFMFSHDDTYVGNTFTDNGAGVAVMFTRGVKMINNIFRQNWGSAAYGVLLKEISDSYIEGNLFDRNTTGIMMEGGSRISVVRNRFYSNGWAFRIQASSIENLIESNNFIGNTFDIATNGSLSQNEFRGNYWDKYEGYDLNRNGIGDVPFRPISMYSMIVERNPTTMMLFRSFMVNLLDKAEKVIPSLTPENLLDDQPLMKPLKL